MKIIKLYKEALKELESDKKWIDLNNTEKIERLRYIRWFFFNY